MPKLLELQAKLSQIECRLYAFIPGNHFSQYLLMPCSFSTAQMGAVPSDVKDQISSMQKEIDSLSAELASVSENSTTCTKANYLFHLQYINFISIQCTHALLSYYIALFGGQLWK